MNATHLFGSTDKKNGLLPNSESYWTTLFSFYLLHLSTACTANKLITTWSCTDRKPFWFERQPKSVWLSVDGLKSKDITIETPNGLVGIWKNNIVDEDYYFTGISPDILFRIPQSNGNDRYVIIENKVRTGADLNSNQKTSYRDLVLSKEINCSLFLLQSLGANNIYKSAVKLQEEIHQSNRFGVILWEDVIRCMKRDDFTISGINFDDWKIYTEDGKDDCKDWDWD